MPNFTRMGGIPEGYDSLLGNARQQLVRLPDGTYVQAPQFGQGTSLEEIYGGILPPTGPTTRTVSTIPVRPSWAPQDSLSAQSGSRSALTEGTQAAGTAQMPPGARPASVDQAFASMGIPPLPTPPVPRMRPQFPPAAPWDPFGTSSVAKDETRLPANDGGEAGFMEAFFPSGGNPATAAIDNATGGVPMPQRRPLPPGPPVPRQRPLTPYMDSPSYMDTPGSPFMVRGGYTVKKGDTLSALAKKFGTTVGQLANANNIANPNKISAGATLNLGFLAPPVPRTPNAAQRWTSPISGTPAAPQPQGSPSSPSRPAGYGSKGYSEGGALIQRLYGNG